jgi:hypothetical protein
MFVLCVLHSKDNQDKEVVEMKYREQKKSCPGYGCVLSSTGLFERPIPRPEECVTMCDTETSRMRRPWPALGCCAGEENCLSPARFAISVYQHIN